MLRTRKQSPVSGNAKERQVLMRSKSKSKLSPRKKNLPLKCASSTPPSRRLLDRVVDYDHRFSYWMHEHALQSLFYVFLRVLEFSGDGIFLIPAAGATYLLPAHDLTPEVRLFFFNLFGAFVVDLVIVTLIKNYVRRHRPMCRCPHMCNQSFEEYWSFPSGHSTRALMVVTFFTMYMPMWRVQATSSWLPFLRRLLHYQVNILDEGVPMLENFLISVITWLVFSWAVAVTSSRIILGRHFFFDVLIGCFVGMLESVLYNNFLVIPPEVSLAVHGYISSFFVGIEDAVWRLFNNASFYVESLTKR